MVHRDLKPGNVWLTSDGAAKIGDFGLAVAEGRSRLTQHGMMVGTFGYMPPEQALGQEVTPQADLYGLGARLHQLVTGAPPFVGTDSTAVISQDLNTAPVQPSLGSEHSPADLEALILHLLAKAARTAAQTACGRRARERHRRGSAYRPSRPAVPAGTCPAGTAGASPLAATCPAKGPAE